MARNGVASWRMRPESTDFSRPDSTEAHVLAVDDSLLDRKVIERLLKISSCKVTAVDSGVRALEFLGLHEQKSPPNFDSLKVDLIITDYCMPGMNGYELLKKIKESAVLRQIPVVIMSSENVMARIDRCLEEGAEDFIVKPVKLSDVKRLKNFMTRDSTVKAAAATTVTAAATDGDKEMYNNHKRKLRESSDDQFSSPPSTSPLSSPLLSPSPESLSTSSPSPSAVSSPTSSPPSSAPDSPSPLESPTRRLRIANSY